MRALNIILLCIAISGCSANKTIEEDGTQINYDSDKYIIDIVKNSPSALKSCLIHFYHGLPKRFNIYSGWNSYCNLVKNTAFFKKEAYKKYGKNGLFSYPKFESDFSRVVALRVDRSKLKPMRINGKLISSYTSNSGSKSWKFTCSGLSKSQAYSLLKDGHSYLDRDGDGHPCEWGNKRAKPTYSGNCHYVGGYYRKSGTYVRGHMRCR